MQTVDFTKNFVNGTLQRKNDGNEYVFVKLNNDIKIGRIGVYKIEQQNRIGEIGYWIVENSQGNGIVTACSKTLLDFCFNKLNLNNIDIKCAT